MLEYLLILPFLLVPFLVAKLTFQALSNTQYSTTKRINIAFGMLILYAVLSFIYFLWIVGDRPPPGSQSIDSHYKSAAPEPSH
jgi:uncharacterized membrane protein